MPVGFNGKQGTKRWAFFLGWRLPGVDGLHIPSLCIADPDLGGRGGDAFLGKAHV